MANIGTQSKRGLLTWFRKRRLGTKQFFFVTFVVLDMQIGRLLRNVRIIAELILVNVVLRSVRKQSILQVRQCYQRKSRKSVLVKVP